MEEKLVGRKKKMKRFWEGKEKNNRATLDSTEAITKEKGFNNVRLRNAGKLKQDVSKGKRFLENSEYLARKLTQL